MFLDLFLISQAEALANGRYIHKVKNMVAAYHMAYELALASGTDEDVEMFKQTQKDLRKFINRRKVEKVDPDEYEIDVMEND
jgi:hypothetical protein